MAVGSQVGSANVNQALSDSAIAMRDLMHKCVNLSTWINGQNQGLNTLIAMGFSNTPNANNTGGLSDAALALRLIADLNTVAGVYFGTVLQGNGGVGGIGTTFDFDNELSQLWAGR